MEVLLKSGDYNALAEHCEQEELKVSKLQAREGIGIFMRVELFVRILQILRTEGLTISLLIGSW